MTVLFLPKLFINQLNNQRVIQNKEEKCLNTMKKKQELHLDLRSQTDLDMYHTQWSSPGKKLERTKGVAPAHLFVCPSMRFCTFLFELNGRGHIDPGVTPPAPHS